MIRRIQGWGKWLLLLMGPLTCVLTVWLLAGQDLSMEARYVLGITLWAAVWWAFEVVPMAITSLLPMIGFPLAGVFSMAEAAKGYAHPLIYLFFGGFVIALAMERWNLHRRIALFTLSLMGTKSQMVILGFMLATAGLSMWISNTATAVMMMPIGLAVIAQFRSFAKAHSVKGFNTDYFAKALMLSIAYSASIGGVATLVGTPTNVVFSGFMDKYYGIDFPFDRWMLFGTPLMIILLLISWVYLVKWAFPLPALGIPGIGTEIKKQLKALGKISAEEKRVLSVFILVALTWISRSYLIKPYFPSLNDTVIALIGAILLFIIPAPSIPGQSLMNWEHTRKLPWEILLLFGAGFSIAAAFGSSGLDQWIGSQMTGLKSLPLFLLLLAITGLVNFLTEINSNMATCTMILPILAALAPVVDVHPYVLLVSATISASCAFMLPVATAPNAVVFGSGYLKIKDMVRAGFLLNLISILVIVVFTYFVMGSIWDMSPQPYVELKQP